MSFGKSNFDKGKGSGFKNAKLASDKQGGTTRADFRIFPAMHESGKTGQWAIYYGQHWGYSGRDPSDPTKSKMRPFRCVEKSDFRTKRVTVACPECDLISHQKALMEKKKELFTAEGKSGQDVLDLTSDLKDWLKSHNCDRKWRMFAMNSDGEMVLLSITHKCKASLDAAITRFRQEEGRDPLDLDDGVWFTFERTGSGIQVVDSVSVAQERVTIEGRSVKVNKVGPITEEVARQALATFPDLQLTCRVLSVDQVQKLVDSDGNPTDVDSVFELSSEVTRERSASPVRTESVGIRTAPPPPPPAPASPARAAAPTSPPFDADTEEDDDAIERKLLALQAKKAAKKTAAAPVASTMTAATERDVTDAAFMAMVNRK